MSTSSATLAAQSARRRSSPLARRKAIEGYLYISPFLLGFLIFTAYPLLASLLPQLHQLQHHQRSDLDRPGELPARLHPGRAVLGVAWAGLEVRAAGGADRHRLLVAGAAMLLNQGFRGTTIFRTFFFLPSITPDHRLGADLALAASALDRRASTTCLGLIGIPGPPWVQSTTWAIPSLVILSLWDTVGGSRMIVFLAGAPGRARRRCTRRPTSTAPNRWQRFCEHDPADDLADDVLQPGGLGHRRAVRLLAGVHRRPRAAPPTRRTSTSTTCTSNAFQFTLMGYASAMAWVFLVIVLALTAGPVSALESLGLLRRRRHARGGRTMADRAATLPRTGQSAASSRLDAGAGA